MIVRVSVPSASERQSVGEERAPGRTTTRPRRLGEARRWLVAVLTVVLVPVTAIVGTATVASAAAPFGAVTIAARGLSYPQGVAAGADGNIWFTSWDNDAIGRITPAGAITLFVDPSVTHPWNITAGPDGNLWFTTGYLSEGFGAIGRITPAGVITTFTDASIASPQGITAGPDGNVWFTELGSIGRITSAGVVTTFTDLSIRGASSITTGPDGNLWFTNRNGSSIGRITPAGVVSSFTGPGVNEPLTIVSGPGGLWFTNDIGAGVGRITTAGVLTAFADPSVAGARYVTTGSDGNLWITVAGSIVRLTPAGVATPFDVSSVGPGLGITSGADGALWFAAPSAPGAIGRLTTEGVLTSFAGPPVASPLDITVGPDGNLWFTNNATGRVSRMTAAGAITSFASGPQPHGIATGPDGNLWITIDTGIARMTTAGVVNTFTDPDVWRPEGIVAGADGNLWFTTGNSRIGRITPAGTISTYPLGVFRRPGQIAAGPDGALWFTDSAANEIGRITTAGVIKMFSGVASSVPTDIVAGPDGNLWFTNARAKEIDGGSIGRITPTGVVDSFTAPAIDSPTGITVGADGALWFANTHGRSLARITTAGTVTAVPSPLLNAPAAVVAGPDGNVWFTDIGGNAVGFVGTTPTVPGPPTNVFAEAGPGDATVSWSGPLFTGGAAITGYQVTAAPGGASCTTTAAWSCTVGGLAGGVPHTFTVRAVNGIGPGAPSEPSAAVVPTASSTFHPLAPVRVLDSRTSVGGWNGPLDGERTLPVAGVATVPSTASSVVANVTVTGGTRPSFVTVWPAGTSFPSTSNVNFGPGETIANLTTVRLGAAGELAVQNHDGAADVIIDVLGYYDDGAGSGDLFNATVPSRVLDSRTPTGSWGSPLVAGAPRDLALRPPVGSAVPATATAVVLNVTATAGTAGSFVSVWPSGAVPSTSNINFAAGQTIPNLVVVPIGAAGSIRFANAVGQVDLVADLVGYFDPTAGSRFHAMAPKRILDDRVGTGLSGPWGAEVTRELPVAGAPWTRVPAGATGLVANVTATAATTPSFVAVLPHGAARTTSNLNFAAGQTIPNLVAVGLPASGSIDLYNHLGTVDLVADAMGYYAPT